jgi:scyllo-inositol 2-dehydrogenase (NAD+)
MRAEVHSHFPARRDPAKDTVRTMKRVKVGCVGLGRMGSIYARHFSGRVPEAELAAVADPAPGLARRTAAELGVPRWYEDYRELVASPEVEAVVIATPSNTHADVIEAAASSGRPMFCEKPLALTLEDCDRAIRAVERAGVLFQIGYNRRFDAAYTEAKRLIEDGAIGTPVTFKAVSRDPMMPRLEYARPDVSGGLILDMAIHDLDVGRWVMRSEVARVSAEGGTLVFHQLDSVGDFDNAVINLKFASGALGNVEVSRNALYGYDIRTEVLGSEGGVMIGTLQQTPVLLLTRQGARYDVMGYILERFSDSYLAEVRHVVRAVQGEEKPGPTIYDGRAGVEIALAATQSYREGRPVSLPLL